MTDNEHAMQLGIHYVTIGLDLKKKQKTKKKTQHEENFNKYLLLWTGEVITNDENLNFKFSELLWLFTKKLYGNTTPNVSYDFSMTIFIPMF